MLHGSANIEGYLYIVKVVQAPRLSKELVEVNFGTLPLQCRLQHGIIPPSADGEAAQDAIDLLLLGTAELHISHILLHPFCGGGAGDRDDGACNAGVRVGFHPGEGKLGGRDMLFRGDGLELFDEFEVFGKVLRGKCS